MKHIFKPKPYNLFTTKVISDNGTIFKFDKDNNQIYYENCDGYWIKQVYNETTQEFHVLNSNGHSEKRLYDAGANIIYKIVSSWA